MKKNLNIAYLNGAEGMIRRGAASSGGSGSEEQYIKAYRMKLCPYDGADMRRYLDCMFPKYYSSLDGVIYYGNAFVANTFPSEKGTIAPEFLFVKNKGILGELTMELNSPKDFFELHADQFEHPYVEYEEISVEDFFNSPNRYIFRITYEDTGETKDYYSDLGMQLKDWVDSNYNTDNIILDGNDIFIKDSKRYHFICGLDGIESYSIYNANSYIAYTHVLAKFIEEDINN